MKTMHRFLSSLLMCLALGCLFGCSGFTSIDREPNGDYVLTGWQAPGPHGFVWVCSYDPATKTLKVKEELPR